MVVSLHQVLGWVYTAEERAKAAKTPKAYFAERDGTMAGQTVAGLVYVRGLTTHQMESGSTEAMESALVLAGPNTLVLVDADTLLVTAAYCWKPLAQLPAPGTPEKHGRDLAYEQHVAGKLLLPPLEVAAGFLRAHLEAS